jgi:predicted ATP-grasp superfamily ATP-dependent carboligase
MGIGYPASVIIGDHTQGLGILRSAAVTGSDVWVVNDKTLGLTRFSKYVSGYVYVGGGTLSHLSIPLFSDVLLNALLELPVQYPSVLFGVNEDITRFIDQHADKLRKKFLIPDVRFERIYDKYLFNLQLPDAARIDTRLYDETETTKLENPHSFIVKGRQGNIFKKLTGEKAIRLDCFGPHQRRRLFGPLSSDQVIIQEIIETDRPVLSVCSLSTNGQTLGIFAYEKLRQHPNMFGTGTYLRSVRADFLEPVTNDLLKNLNFTGISEVEFIFDTKTGAYKIIEMNPRTWKSVHFSTQCGQNLVARYLRHIATGDFQRDDRYDVGRYWVDLATDIPQMIREMRLRGYERGFFECTWDKCDPWPAVILWTLFPLIVLENGVSSILAMARARS